MPFDIFCASNDVYQSWIEYPFRFIEPTTYNGNLGLRKPQRAALYTTLAHLISNPASPATVVMPTGTGKTDTIFALLVAGKFPRTLIIVPSDALREQTAGKIVHLSNLRKMQAVLPGALSPRVEKIASKLSMDEINDLEAANVIIATPQALQNFNDAELNALSILCSHLVIDEAHHVAARTWKRIRLSFEGKPSIQFTATPFREDGASLGGSIIYNYSLKEAQQDKYFQEIEFHPIREYQPSLADEAIAAKAISLLENDLAAGFNHLMLVRARSKEKAAALFEIYKKYPALTPVLIHSGVSDRTEVLERIKNKQHRIIVCVDMLGEGFDLPELKIAAIHDQHRSPAVTLQFIGRLTRVSTLLGTAKFVANIANQAMDEQMSALYEESADWSAVIRDVSAKKIQREIEKEEFNKKFDNDASGKKILALNPEPNISAVAFELDPNNWQPKAVLDFDSRRETAEFRSVSSTGDLVILVTRAELPVPWANTAEITDVRWCIYAAYYDSATSTVFVHSGGDEKESTKFRELVAPGARKILGERTFRLLHGIDYMKLQNVGLSRATQSVRFTMHVGRDINAIMHELETGSAIKSNVFATGHAHGHKTTAGCSYKGKIWEMNSASIDRWVKWCAESAKKLNDATIDTQSILNNVMRAEQIRGRWPEGIFFADWPDEIAIENENKISLVVKGESFNLLDVSLSAPTLISNSELEIHIIDGRDAAKRHSIGRIRLILLSDGYQYICEGVKIVFGKELTLADYLNDGNPLRLLKQDGSFIHGNLRYYSPSTINVRIPMPLLEAWGWGATNIQSESMGKTRDLNTVQGFTFTQISSKYEIIFNDDGAGEIADLVAISEKGNKIIIDLYHCKYCSAVGGVAKPGGRVGDTYEVTGQASRSAKWLHNAENLIRQLLHRYGKSKDAGFDRMLQGKLDRLEMLGRKCRDLEAKFGFYIVQPAISLAKITDEQRAVLGTSYVYIKGVAGVDLRVVTSA